MNNKGAKVIISGVVQGVFFRASTREMALGMGLTGWVRNLPDGDVEALFEGPAETIEEAIAWCHHGPKPVPTRSVDRRQSPEPVGPRHVPILRAIARPLRQPGRATAAYELRPTRKNGRRLCLARRLRRGLDRFLDHGAFPERRGPIQGTGFADFRMTVIMKN